MYKRLLVPLDGSSNANEALKTAIDLAQDWHAKLILLQVIDITQFSAQGLGGGYAAVIKSLRDTSQEILEAARDHAEEANLEVAMLVREGAPKQVIVEIANAADSQIDLIVMGKSGTNAFSRMIVGSTTNYVVQHAEPNVIVVNDLPEPHE
ncbi:universal stress protein [Levilactobacillus parabrevis]|uniref:UspA family nucleotide-binding protein n=1 Tax=Levilactobacillus parabrevis ATCC 53295 TaxID=1267003 RepID=A0A0R1H5H8_9LACO|nr:universal stress protein [Levilactobacillus parabrevis]KRK39140.1 UspA family nucleotide-binding protein [Levilactobacillus parabrevis ATCC 53295]KRO06770.1 UspA family nucleotide-binding protein [Levilactobacillus parabrevis]MCT4487071.1 universal stress protein [Levilactobacillus parabrevis]MCT4489935.1 universal stress protein [Levilactobacillus parabrevis]